jgi:hypothetical protein
VGCHTLTRTLQQCSRCGTRYCSPACQRAHFPTHRDYCGKAEAVPRELVFVLATREIKGMAVMAHTLAKMIMAHNDNAKISVLFATFLDRGSVPTRDEAPVLWKDYDAFLAALADVPQPERLFLLWTGLAMMRAPRWSTIVQAGVAFYGLYAALTDTSHTHPVVSANVDPYGTLATLRFFDSPKAYWKTLGARPNVAMLFLRKASPTTLAAILVLTSPTRDKDTLCVYTAVEGVPILETQQIVPVGRLLAQLEAFDTRAWEALFPRLPSLSPPPECPWVVGTLQLGVADTDADGDYRVDDLFK